MSQAIEYPPVSRSTIARWRYLSSGILISMDGSTPIVVTPRSVVFTHAERLLKSAEDDGNQSYKAKADTLLSKLQSAQQSDRKLYSRMGQTGDLPTCHGVRLLCSRARGHVRRTGEGLGEGYGGELDEGLGE